MLLNHSTAFTSFEPATDVAETPRQIIPAPALTAGTMVETQAGWMPVERLSLGDAVYTFDGGLAPIAGLRQIRLTAGTQLWHVPGGALNNCADIFLTRDQHVMIFDDNAEDLYDTPYVLVPATALQGFRGTRQVDCVPGTVAVEVTFDTEEAVFANSGTLLRCAAQSGKGDGFFRALTNAEARILLALLDTDETERLHALAA
ncbi:Hint domain-containing protein [Roseovarius sp. CAU 1744]|uniref:Hint domain-containing protein n=1 Tax=Roseovarius sp. CAU 1744 TaxID=3140368 RepID=UPI00325B39CE